MYDLLIKLTPVIAVAALSGAGSIALKANVETPNENLLMGGLIAFFISNFFWLQVLRSSEGLGQAVILSTMMTTILLTLVSAAFFNEPLGQKQVTSLIFASLALSTSLFFK